MDIKDIFCILLAYLLGGICTGYWLVRFHLSIDVREQGSGGAGGRNVGRLLGWPGFLLTATGDLLKGTLAVILARQIGATELAVSLSVLAVVVGHVWPVTLGFRGGRGISPVVGALAVYEPWLLLLFLISTLFFMVFRRGITFSGLAAFLVLPVGAATIFEISGPDVTVLAVVSAVVLFTHREYIHRAFNEALSRQEA